MKLISEAESRTVKKTGIIIFPAILIAVISQNYYDIALLMSEGHLALYAYDGPLYLKAGKDIVYISLLTCGLIGIIREKNKIIDYYSVAIFVVISALFLVSLAANSIIIALIGVRWILPLLIFLVIKSWADRIDIRQALIWIMTGQIMCFGMQVYQLFNMPPVFGEIAFSLAARTPGIFIAPNSAAFFSCSIAAFVLSAANNNMAKLRILSVLLSVITSVLAQSGTGMLVSFVLVLWLCLNGRPVLFSVSSVIFSCIIFLNLNLATQREDYVAISGGGRVDVLVDIASASAFSVTNFGVYTNAANLQSGAPEDAIAPDSLVASWIGNFGLMAIPVFVLLIFSMKRRARQSYFSWNKSFPCFIVLGAFSATTIVFEAFPMNVYLSLGIWLGVESSRVSMGRPYPMKAR